MTDGLKPGAGSDPFDETEDVDSATADRDSDSEEDLAEESLTDQKLADSGTAETNDTDSSLPWLYSRDGVKSARQHTYQLHLQASTRDREKRFQADIEEALGEDVYKTDLREAALLVAMDRPEAVLAQLREWGYDV